MLDWIELHATFVGMLFKLFCGIISFMIAAILYYFKFYRKQRGIALFGFYMHYEALLSVLEKQLNRCTEKNNPYVLMYTVNARGRLGLSLPGDTEQETIKQFAPVAKELKKLLLNTDNVYPKTSSKTEWYEHTKTILNFALMLTDGLNIQTIGYSENTTDYKDCLKTLKTAIENIQKDIKNTKK